jgi:hypothetical protein
LNDGTGVATLANDADSTISAGCGAVTLIKVFGSWWQADFIFSFCRRESPIPSGKSSVYDAIGRSTVTSHADSMIKVG